VARSLDVGLREVRKRFGRWSPWVLDGVDLRLEPGSTTVVVGANGSGKSTLLRIVAGLTRPTAGEVRGRGRGGVGRSGGVTFAYAPDRLGAHVRMSARDYVAHMARLRGAGPVADTAGAELFERLGLAPGPDVPIRTLSRGNSQKVALTQALISPVDVLLLDEPYAGLDAPARDALTAIVAERADSGTAVVMTAHQPPERVAATRMLRLEAGRLAELASGSTDGRAVVRIVLLATPAATHGDRLREHAGVEQAHDVEGGIALTVAPSTSDEILGVALAHGWSVASVRAGSAEAGRNGTG
jgi:ABC-type multidrug transport system ATPase subunit